MIRVLRGCHDIQEKDKKQNDTPHSVNQLNSIEQNDNKIIGMKIN